MLRLLILGFVTLFAPVAAMAHPHVLVTARAAFIVNDKGAITGVRHAWTFDEMYSAYAVTGMKTGKDGKVPREALQDLAKTNVESLQDFSFFTVLKQGKTQFEFAPPTADHYLVHDGKALTLHFVLPLKQPVPAAKTTVLEIQDESFFVAFSFEESDPVVIEGAARGCRVEMKRPKKSLASADLSSLTESFFNNLQPGFVDQYVSNARLICP